jgi:hypothetical protein
MEYRTNRELYNDIDINAVFDAWYHKHEDDFQCIETHEDFAFEAFIAGIEYQHNGEVM